MQLTCQQIALYLGCPGRYSGIVSGFSQDSRLVQQHHLFFALKGEQVDGHTYLGEVANKGALAAVVSSLYRGPSFGLQLFYVPDVFFALQDLARQVHLKRSCKVVAVTGSVGKTTTKEFIVTLLSGSFRVGKTPGNANSQVGLPLAILNAEGNEEVFVVEMGMTGPGHIKQLVSMVPPSIAVVTKIALCHVLYFENGLEGIAEAKAEIFSHPMTSLGVLNQQVLAFEPFRKLSCEVVTYGVRDADVFVRPLGSQFVLESRGGHSAPFALPPLPSHFIENFSGAAAVALALGLPYEEIAIQARQLTSFAKRFEQVDREGVLFVNDSYNANPTSMQAALSNLPSAGPGGKRIAVLGAMRELGAYEEAAHVDVARYAVDVVDQLLCFGGECAPMVDVFAAARKPVEHFFDRSFLKQRLFEIARSGDVVLLKGSNSNRLWELLD
jgi:UDP-N-acetylmuramoyl-tripeptide--D-alanyl-D-alanine ligase